MGMKEIIIAKDNHYEVHRRIGLPWAAFSKTKYIKHE